MLSSLARYLEPLPDEEGESFLTQVHALLQSDFITKHRWEGEGSLNTSPRPVDNLAADQLLSQNRFQEGDTDPDCGRASGNNEQITTETTSETNSNTVLHMGSVLSTEHDYLLWWTSYISFVL